MKSVIYQFIRVFYQVLILGVSIVPLLLLAFWYRFQSAEASDQAVFIGVNEIASNIHSIQETLDLYGEKTTALIYTNKFSGEAPFYGVSGKARRIYINKYYSSSWLHRFFYIFVRPVMLLYYFAQFLKGHRIWFFVWNHTFLPWNLDLVLLRLAGKRVILMHCGDDVRYRPMQRAIDRSFGIDSWSSHKPSFKVFLRHFYFSALSEVVGDVISLRDQATFQRGSLIQFKFPMADIKKSGDGFFKKEAVRILHAPSDREIKGTRFVLEAIEILRQLGIPFEFKLIEKESNERVLKEINRADILIDQPGTWVARLAMEGCSAGCCVIGGNQAEYMQNYDSPVIQFEKDAKKLANVLSELICDRDLLRNKKRECRIFWEKYYTQEAFYRHYESILRGTAPTFLPLRQQKQILISSSSNWLERMIVRFCYYPKQS